jgi:hypothetical protein
MSTEQASLEFEAPLSSDSWFACLARKNVLASLASGVLGPKETFSRYRPYDALSYFPGSFPVAISPIAFALAESVREKESEDFLVLIELREERTTVLPAISYLADATRVEVGGKKPSKIVLRLVQAVIPVSDIKVLHFRSNEELEDFQARGFENVPQQNFICEVSPALFDINSKTKEAAAAISEAIQPGAVSTGSAALERAANLADRWAGGFAMLLQCLPTGSAWCKGVEEIARESYQDARRERRDSGPGQPGWLVDAVARMAVVEDTSNKNLATIDMLLFDRALAVVSGMDSAKGWDPLLVLEEIAALDLADTQPDVSIAEWKNICSEVLNNQREASSLGFGDAKSVVKRALLLLLLRPGPNDIVGSIQSSLQVGARVRALASFLSGVRVGFEGLANEKKGDADRYFAISQLKSAQINRKIVGPTYAAMQQSISDFLAVSHEKIGLAGHRRTISAGGRKLLHADIEPALALRRVRDTAESLGLSCSYDDQYLELRLDVSGLSESKVKIICVTNIGATDDDGYVRIWAPFMDLSKQSGKRWLTKARLMELMVRNADPELHCSLAISWELESVVALVDQFAATLDEKELELHIRSILQGVESYFR